MRRLTPPPRIATAAALLALAACGSDDPAAVISPAPTGPASLHTAIFQKPTKTAEGYRERSITYDWDLVKSVSPDSAQIGTGSTASFQYSIAATRTGTTTDVVGVRGQICVKNLGSADSQGMTVVDVVQQSINGGPWTQVLSQPVDVSGNPVVSPLETACFNYNFTFTPVDGATYRNQGRVTWTNAGNGGVGDPGTMQIWETLWVPFTIPTTVAASETDETAVINDLLVCPTGFTCTPSAGTWTLTGTQTIQYAVEIRNVSAPCGHGTIARNTATLREGDSGQTDSDSAEVEITTPRCEPPPPPPGLQGCTPGYWKQTQHFGNWTGYIPTGATATRFNAAFGVNLFADNRTLLTALSTGGGGANRLGRHASAALLNAASGGVDYPMTTAQVIAAVQAAVASGNYDAASNQFERNNELGCPLGRAD